MIQNNKQLPFYEFKLLLQRNSVEIDILLSKKPGLIEKLTANVLDLVSKNKIEKSSFITNELMKEEMVSSVYNCLKLHFEDLILNFDTIKNKDQCPDKCRISCDTIVYASRFYNELGLINLPAVEKQLQNQFGTFYIQRAKDNIDNLVSNRIINHLPFRNYSKVDIDNRIKSLLASHNTRKISSTIIAKADQPNNCSIQHRKIIGAIPDFHVIRPTVTYSREEYSKNSLNEMVSKDSGFPLKGSTLPIVSSIFQNFEYPSLEHHSPDLFLKLPINDSKLSEVRISLNDNEQINQKLYSFNNNRAYSSSYNTTIESKCIDKALNDKYNGTIGNLSDCVQYENYQTDDHVIEQENNIPQLSLSSQLNEKDQSSNSFSLFN